MGNTAIELDGWMSMLKSQATPLKRVPSTMRVCVHQGLSRVPKLGNWICERGDEPMWGVIRRLLLCCTLHWCTLSACVLLGSTKRQCGFRLVDLRFTLFKFQIQGHASLGRCIPQLPRPESFQDLFLHRGLSLTSRSILQHLGPFPVSTGPHF